MRVCLDFFFPEEKEYTLVYIMSLIYIYIFFTMKELVSFLSLSSLGVHFGVDAAKRTRASEQCRRKKMIGGGFELFFEV